ncbi:MAG: DNA-directed RNA polymerase subunit omega [Phycisphaerae bacterium]|nr:DNA-directed RNA polymerase subunit omega [Phycisphaerae bacterium]
MIEELKDTTILNKIGGRFKLSALIQKRMIELMEGGRPLIEDTEGMTSMEIVVEEIRQGKIVLEEAAAQTPKKEKIKADPF